MAPPSSIRYSNGHGGDALSIFCNEHCTYLPAMLGWFLFSALLSTYNKFVFGNGHMNFPCPLLLTSMHFGVQWFIAHIACHCFPESLGSDRVQNMSWKEWASISIPCGMVTALDVGLSNLALVTLTLTFYTMVKSSTPVFVLGWAHLFDIERITWPLIGVVLIIAAGEFLTVYGEVDFVLRGFLLCLVASILSGARWTLVQLKLQRLDPPLKSTIVTMKLLAPSMFWSMLLTSMVVEHPWKKLKNTENSDALLGVLGLGLVGGLLAVIMILCEFYLILKASALILMIGGVVKELTNIAIGVSFFGDKLNAVNATGVCIVFSGVVMYKVVFHYEKDARRVEAVPITDDDNNDDHSQGLVKKMSSDVSGGGFSDAPDKKYDDRDVLLESNKVSGLEMVDNRRLHLRNPRYPDSGGEDSDVESTGII